MEERYYEWMAAAYLRGAAAAKDISVSDETAVLFAVKLEEMTGEDVKKLLLAGQSLGIRLHYFKRSSGELPRVKRTLGILRGLSFQSLLDVGSGRGVFLIPFLEAFPGIRTLSLDLLPGRAEFLQTLSAGGISNLTAIQGDICKEEIPENAFDIVTLLEVLEHIPNAELAVKRAVEIAAKYVIVSVPSKPDDNPEHIHLLTKPVLTKMFTEAGCRKLHFDGVNGHLILLAAV